MKKFSIGYFADGPWSHGTLNLFLSDPNIKVSFIVVRFKNPDLELIKIAKKNKIKIKSHENINSKNFMDWVKEYSCDLFVSMSFNQIFKKELYSLPKFKSINCHAGLLPFYRGRNILNWVLINNETHFGITVHFIDSGIDTGDIILQKKYKISQNDNYGSLLSKSYLECPKLLYKAILSIQNNTFKTIKQKDIHPEGFYCSKRIVGDEKLSWNQTSNDIFNFIRGISKPGPQARTYFNKNEVFINKSKLVKKVKNYKGILGCVTLVKPKSFYVKTLDSFIEITEWTNYEPKIGDRLG